MSLKREIVMIDKLKRSTPAPVPVRLSIQNRRIIDRIGQIRKRIIHRKDAKKNFYHKGHEEHKELKI